jgi:hypothetical protein
MCKRPYWSTKASSVAKLNTWCPQCGNEKRRTQLLKAIKIAAEKEGSLLTKNLEVGTDAGMWKCKEGHIWKAKVRKIAAGSWCPICAIENKKIGIDKMYAVAESRGGKCLSNIYKDTHSHLKWQCSKGHIWMATSSNVMRGTWCPYCRKIKKSM